MKPIWLGHFRSQIPPRLDPLGKPNKVVTVKNYGPSLIMVAVVVSITWLKEIMAKMTTANT